jgi:hypothetical protein
MPHMLNEKTKSMASMIMLAMGMLCMSVMIFGGICLLFWSWNKGGKMLVFVFLATYVAFYWIDCLPQKALKNTEYQEPSSTICEDDLFSPY